MNLKAFLLGSLAFFLVSLLLAFILAIPDEAFFEQIYDEVSLWRGDFSGSSKFLYGWVTQKMIFAMGFSLVFQWIFPSIQGPGWRRGIIFGLSTCLFVWATYLGLWSVLDLPGILWIWWGGYYLIISVIGGAAMGRAVEFFT